MVELSFLNKKEEEKKEAVAAEKPSADKKLLMYGFGNAAFIEHLKKNKVTTKFEDLSLGIFDAKKIQNYVKENISNKEAAGFADWGSEETYMHTVAKSSTHPKPIRRFVLKLSDPNKLVSKMYYMLLRFMGERFGLNKNDKIIDSMGLGVSSSMFGNIQSRMAAQQAQASQYMKGISEMLKGLFQIVREIRVIEERLQFYYDSDSESSKLALSSDVVLKGMWIDQVEGGAKNPGSVYGMSSTIGFTILPDLFFRTLVRKKEDLENIVDKMKWNEKVKEVLKRKLRQYLEWKTRTQKELEQRRNFEISYLKQHYNTIKLYSSWVMPYLKNIRKLRQTSKLSDKIDIITAFETSRIEIETLHWRAGFGGSNAVVSLNLGYRVTPDLSFHEYEYQNKGPIHKGRLTLNIRCYAWTAQQIKNFQEYKKDDDLDLLTEIDESIKIAMSSLGDDLKKYLDERETRGVFKSEEKKEEKKPDRLPGILDPFISIFGGFGELAKGFTGGQADGKKKKKKAKKPEEIDFGEVRSHEEAMDYARNIAWKTYQYFKEQNKMLFWEE